MRTTEGGDVLGRRLKRCLLGRLQTHRGLLGRGGCLRADQRRRERHQRCAENPGVSKTSVHERWAVY